MDPSRAQYFLSLHVFVARVENAVILLDSQTDDYILIESDVAPGFLSLLSHEECPDEDARLRSDPAVARLVRDLEDRGSITTNASLGKPLRLLTMVSGNLEIPGPRIDAIPKIGLAHVGVMSLAVLKSFYLLKIRGMSAAIRHVRRSRRRASRHAKSPADPSLLVEVYHRVRPIFYSSKDRCLFNSLTLINFLAWYGIYPSWSFGVRIKPFLAHCWVEDEQWLYNDQYMRIHRYTPIMRV